MDDFVSLCVCACVCGDSFGSFPSRFLPSFLQQADIVFQFGQQTFDTAGAAFGSQATREYERSSSPEWLHMQIGGSFERTT